MNDNNTCECGHAKVDHHNETYFCCTLPENPNYCQTDDCPCPSFTPAGGEVELLDCPFCGEVPRYQMGVRLFDNKPPSMTLWCGTKGCALYRHVVEPTAWNRRAESPDLKAAPALSTPDDVLEIMRELNEDNARLTAEVERLSKELETARNDAQGMTDLWREAQKGQ